jgi:hypothetical protein
MMFPTIHDLTIQTGSKTIVINGNAGDDFSLVQPGSYIFVKNSVGTILHMENLVSGTKADVNGASTLTLLEDWPYNPVENQYGTVLLTLADLLEQTALVKYLGDLLNQHIKFRDDDLTLEQAEYSFPTSKSQPLKAPTLGYLRKELADTNAEAMAAVNTLTLPKAADSGDRRQIRRKLYEQSGVINTGKIAPENASNVKISSGIYSAISTSSTNALWLGRDNSDGVGDSETGYAVFNVDGIRVHANYVNTNNTLGRAKIPFPDAITPSIEEATTTATSAYSLQDWVVNGNDAYCCIAPASVGDDLTDTTKFLYSKEGVVRTSLVGVEVYPVKLTGSGRRPFYPRGNVQNGQTSYEGITMEPTSALGIDGVGAAYTRFGEWDTTDGLGKDWKSESLTTAQRELLASNPENNIEVLPGGEVVQWHARWRVIIGFGPKWDKAFHLDGTGNNNAIRFYNTTGGCIQAIGSQNGGTDYTTDSLNYLFCIDHQNYHLDGRADPGIATAGPSFTHSVGGKCHFLPLLLVRQGNTGAYHKFHNEHGYRRVNNDVAGFSSGTNWYLNDALEIPTAADCFNVVDASTDTSSPGAANVSGRLGQNSGRPDGRSYDAIYPEQVQDLRKWACKNEQSVEEVQNNIERNQLRGTEVMTKLELLDHLSEATLTVSNPAVYEGLVEGKPRIKFDVNATTQDSSRFIREERYAFYIVGDNGEIMDVYGFFHIAHVDGISYLWTSDRTDTRNRAAEFNTKFPVGTTISAIRMFESEVPASGEHSVSDFIGTLAKLREVMDRFGEKSVYGQWIPTIPDGTSKIFTLTEKTAGTSHLRIDTPDAGATWINRGANWGTGTSNSFSEEFEPNELSIVSYTAYANALTPAVLPPDIKWRGSVVISNSHARAVLCSHGTGNVPTSTGQNHTFELPATMIDEDGNVHHTIPPLTGNSPGCKYQVILDGSEYGYLVVNALEYDGTDYGDTGKLTQMDNTGMILNDNVQYVPAGTFRFHLGGF